MHADDLKSTDVENFIFLPCFLLLFNCADEICAVLWVCNMWSG